MEFDEDANDQYVAILKSLLGDAEIVKKTAEKTLKSHLDKLIGLTCTHEEEDASTLLDAFLDEPPATCT